MLRILLGIIVVVVIDNKNAVASSNAENDTKILRYTHNHGPYSSEYAHVCDSVAPSYVQFGHALTACQTILGSEWSLATFPSIDSSKGFRAAINKPVRSNPSTWFGGRRSTASSNWTWQAGRLAGRRFAVGDTCQPLSYFGTNFTHCPWLEAPSDTATGSDCTLFSGSQPNLLVTNVASSTALPCFACERSPCQLDTDCYAPNTLTMGQYYPKCDCVCKIGAWGDRCEFPIVVEQGPYESHYIRVCNESNITWFAADQQCSTMGPEWGLASFPTPSAIDAFRDTLTKFGYPLVNVWTSAALDLSDSLTWRWTRGRVGSQAFWKSNAAYTYIGDYFNLVVPNGGTQTFLDPTGIWVPSEPNMNGPDYFGQLWAAAPSANGYLDNAPFNNSRVSCYACERSPCRIVNDCYEPNTVSVIGGYFPNCTCLCKPGSSGYRCARLTVNYGTYTSEYQQVCSGPPVNAFTASSKCTALGEGWDVATFPTNASLQQYIALLEPSQRANSWVAALRTNNSFRWTAGRLAGLAFFNGTNLNGTCLTYNYSLYSTYTTFSECNWQPDLNPNDSGECVYLWVYNNNMLFDDYHCGSGYSCVACERSPCNISSDCNPEGTVSVNAYYPCTCLCKSGYTGSRCERAPVNYGAYTSAYQQVCSDPVNFTDAKNKCTALGEGWDVATFPTNASLQQYVALLEPSQIVNTWVAVAKTNISYRWTAGRLAGLAFYDALYDGGILNGTCLTYNYSLYSTYSTFSECNWHALEPNGGNLCAYLWPNINGMLLDDYLCTQLISCVACERSPCNISSDCNPEGTVSVNAYYPCTCWCKSGYTGSRCERAPIVVNQGPYTSFYQQVCDVPTNGTGAPAMCSALGPGWALATFPTNFAFEAFNKSLKQAQSTWIGASAVSTIVYWSTGRLSGSAIHHGSHQAVNCTSYNYTNSWGTSIFKYCNFDPGQPDLSGSCVYLWEGKGMNWDDINCNIQV